MYDKLRGSIMHAASAMSVSMSNAVHEVGNGDEAKKLPPTYGSFLTSKNADHFLVNRVTASIPKASRATFLLSIKKH